MSNLNWKSTTLADNEHFEYLNGLWKGKKPPFEKAVVVRNTNFRNDGVLDLSDVAVLDVESRQLQTRRLQRCDIIIERSGGGPKQPVGRVCYFNVEDGRPHSFSNFTTTLRIKNRDVFLPLFVHYNLLHLYRTGFTFPLQRATTGIRNLDFGAYQKAVIPIPPKPEQEKIAAVLWKVQRAIEVEEKMAATARELKQSAMRQLFAQGLGVKTQKETDIGFIPIGWEIKELSLVADFERKSPKQQAASKETPFIPMTLMPEEGLNITEWEMRTDEQIKSGVPVCDGDLLVAKITPCFENGKQGIVRGLPNGVGYATTEVIIIRSKGELLLEYLAYYLRQESVRSYLTSRMEGSTGRQRLPKSAIENLKIPFPPPDEQKEIAGILQTIDRKICIHERKHAALSDLFQTLLNQLMTAQIRVDKLDIDTSEVTDLSPSPRCESASNGERAGVR